MKKSLAMIVTGALITSVFASSVSAADSSISTDQKFEALKAAGIFSGYPDGSAGLDKTITRAEFAKVLDKVNGLPEDATSSSYKDVSSTHWAKSYIAAVTAAGLMNGVGNSLFAPSASVTLEQVAKTLVLSAGLEAKTDGQVTGAVDDWATGYVAAALEAGFISEQSSYKSTATRAQVVDAVYAISGDSAQNVTVANAVVLDETHVQFTFSDGQTVSKTLDTALVEGQATAVSVDYNGSTYSATVTLEKLQATAAKQTGAKSITVDFNRPVSAASQSGLSYTLKYASTTYDVTAAYAEDGKSVVLTASYLPAGDYTLSVTGSSDLSLTIAEETASKLTIDAPALSNAVNQNLEVNLWNQFGEKMTTNLPTINVFNSTKGTSLDVVQTLSKQLVDLSTASVGDTIGVTAYDASAGLSATKTFTVINGSAATVIKLGDVAPLEGDARVYTNRTDYVLPVSLTDASGNAMTLPEGSVESVSGSPNTFKVDGIVFYFSNANSIGNFRVNSDGNLVFDTLGTADTVLITALNPSTGASSSLSLTVNGEAKLANLQISNPGVTVVKGEEVAVPFLATDTYGNAITGTDLDLSNVTFNSGLSMDTPYVNAKGELVFKFNESGTTSISTYVGGVLQSGSVNITVNDPSTPIAVNSVTDVTNAMEVNAVQDLNSNNITFVDNYGRISNVTASTYSVTSSNPAVVSYDNGKLVANSAGTADITVKLLQNGTEVAGSDYTFSMRVVDSSDITSYEISSTNKIYGGNSPSDHALPITLNGKISGGSLVKLADDKATFVTSSDPNVLRTTDALNSVYGVAAGTATITAYRNGNEVATQDVTVSTEVPAAASATFDQDEYDTTVGNTVQPVVTVNDQYGFTLATSHYYSSSNTNVATVDPQTGLVTAVAKGSAIITYRAENGVSVTTLVVVN